MCLKLGLLIMKLLILSIIKNNAVETRKHKTLEVIQNVKDKPSFIAILYPKEKMKVKSGIQKPEPDLTNDITPELDPVEPPYDHKAYLLYHVLRAAEEKLDIDPEAARTLDQTKDILRQALRKRCNKLKSCIKKCPRKKIYKCTYTCKITYDDYDVCEKKCPKWKCGKTMPPSWLMLRQ